MALLSRRHLLAGFLAASLSNTALTESPKRTFQVYDGLLHLRKPSAQKLGLIPLRAVSNIWRSRNQQNVDEHGLILALNQLPPDTRSIFFDIECWPLLKVPSGTRDESIRKFIRVAEITRIHKPTLSFGFYNILPAHTYWPLVAPQFQAEYSEWIAANKALKSLSNLVDYIFPSLYTYYADQKGWIKSATALLDTANEFGKSVLPFLWFEYHDSNKQLQNHEIDPTVWREELRLCKSHADGVVLWGGYQRYWSDQAVWWRTTRAELDILSS